MILFLFPVFNCTDSHGAVKLLSIFDACFFDQAQTGQKKPAAFAAGFQFKLGDLLVGLDHFMHLEVTVGIRMLDKVYPGRQLAHIHFVQTAF